MCDHTQAFHFVEVFLDLWVQGNGVFSGGMYHRMGIVMESDLVFTGESAYAHESNSLIKSSVDLMDLAASGL